MERLPSESSNIRSVGYDEGEKRLEVEFQDGAVYSYADVPREVYEGFKESGFRGGHFHRKVRGLFETTKHSKTDSLKEG